MAAHDRPAPGEITVTASTPVELMQAGLDRLLALVPGRQQAPAVSAGTSAIPVRGLGQQLDALFLDLAAELLAQLEENGPGLNEIRLDGLLRTDTGGYTAWGYLTGDLTPGPAAPIALDVTVARVEPAADGLRLTF